MDPVLSDHFSGKRNRLESRVHRLGDRRRKLQALLPIVGSGRQKILHRRIGNLTDRIDSLRVQLEAYGRTPPIHPDVNPRIQLPRYSEREKELNDAGLYNAYTLSMKLYGPAPGTNVPGDTLRLDQLTKEQWEDASQVLASYLDTHTNRHGCGNSGETNCIRAMEPVIEHHYVQSERLRRTPTLRPVKSEGWTRYGATAPHPPALTRLRVEPKFGIAWIGVAGIITVAGLAIYHGSRHEREARRRGQ